MTPEDQKARDEFEAWYVARQRLNGYGSFLIDSEFVRRMPSGRYRSLPLEDAWQAWQESRRTYRPSTEVDDPGVACTFDAMRCSTYVGCAVIGCRRALRPPCTGRNCATTTANHSPECVADHLRAVAGKE